MEEARSGPGSGSGIGVERSPCRRTSRCSGRGPVNSRSTVNEPGPRGSTDERRAPRGPGSATIDHHLTALAAERQGVRRATTNGWGSEPERVGRRGARLAIGKVHLAISQAELVPSERFDRGWRRVLGGGRRGCCCEFSVEEARSGRGSGSGIWEWRGSGSGIGVERSPCRRTSRCSGRGPVNSRSVFNEPGPRGSVDE